MGLQSATAYYLANMFLLESKALVGKPNRPLAQLLDSLAVTVQQPA